MKSKILALFIIALMLMSACNLENSSGTSTPDANAIYTMAAQTVDGMGTMVAQTLQATVVPAATFTPAQPALPTVAPTLPATILLATLSTVAAAAPVTSGAGCDRASYVSDVTYADGTVVPAGTAFTKTWRLMNAGTCTWGAGYKLVFVSGDGLGGSATALSVIVAPGATIDASVLMTAPTTTGTYTGYWMLQNASGVRFGVGAAATGTFYVNIVVGAGTPGTGTPTVKATPSIFSVYTGYLNANSSTYSGACPMTVAFTGYFTTSQTGSVQYKFIRFDGSGNQTSTSNIYTQTVTGGVAQAVTDSYNVAASGTGSDQLFVIVPNNQAYGTASYSVTCTASITNTPIPATPTFTPGAPTNTPVPPTSTPTMTPTT